MICSLSIKNYLLIDALDLDFGEGFATITGETGAGKSILMGALSLILGQRVDTGILKLKDAKCVVEGRFTWTPAVRELCRENDLDEEEDLVIRREVSPAGKSRAFVNDTPVTLPFLKDLGAHLVDIHSQHQNLRLNDHMYQMEVVDFLAADQDLLTGYRKEYRAWLDVSEEIRELKKRAERLQEEQEYIRFHARGTGRRPVEGRGNGGTGSGPAAAEHAEEIRVALLDSARLSGGRVRHPGPDEGRASCPEQDPDCLPSRRRHTSGWNRPTSI
ncbi:MAG: AAA family ATPase [Bacteroidales bacterium]